MDHASARPEANFAKPRTASPSRVLRENCTNRRSLFWQSTGVTSAMLDTGAHEQPPARMSAASAGPASIFCADTIRDCRFGLHPPLSKVGLGTVAARGASNGKSKCMYVAIYTALKYAYRYTV